MWYGGLPRIRHSIDFLDFRGASPLVQALLLSPMLPKKSSMKCLEEGYKHSQLKSSTRHNQILQPDYMSQFCEIALVDL